MVGGQDDYLADFAHGLDEMAEQNDNHEDCIRAVADEFRCRIKND